MNLYVVLQVKPADTGSVKKKKKKKKKDWLCNTYNTKSAFGVNPGAMASMSSF